jgi:hypothetical protein
MLADVEREWIAEEVRNNPGREGRPPRWGWFVVVLLALAALIWIGL